MKIGFFSPTINRVGGGEWVTLNMINALLTRKHDVLVYSADKIDHTHIKEFFGYPLNFREVNYRPNIFDPYDLENIYPNCLKSFVFSLKCDLLIDTFSNVLLPWADAVYFHGWPRTVALSRGLKGCLFLPYKAIVKYSVDHVKPEEKIFMTCSEWTASNIERHIGFRPKVLYPPVSNFFKAKEINGETKKNLVTTVVRISRDKRPETIPQIAKLVSNEISFVIIGNCKTLHELRTLNVLRESIKKLRVEKKIKVLLNLSREKQREILQSSKSYLHPLLPYETFGISVVEAMYSGCIPIVPDIAGLKEIVPKPLRYTSIEEAAQLVEKSIANWSPNEAWKAVEIADKFNQARFYDEFLKIMKL